MNKTRAMALLGAAATAVLVISPAFAQTVGANASASVGVSGIGSILNTVTGLLTGVLGGI